MARQIAPGQPAEVGALNIQTPQVDFSVFEQIGDAKIKAANTNFKLFAENKWKTEANNAYKKFGNDPIMLSNALGKIQDSILPDLPQELAEQMRGAMYLNGVGLVQKAETNRQAIVDRQNKEYATQGVADSKEIISQTYQDILRNHISKAEDKNLLANDIFLSQREKLAELSGLQDRNGKYVFTDAQRKSMQKLSDVQFVSAKQFIDQMILDDDDDLTNSKDYYTKFILAGDRYMSENFMDRDTYEKVRNYAEQRLKKAGADIKKARFNQSIREAVELQVEDLPGKLESLKENGLIDSKILKQIEKTNAKFNQVDPSKIESPTAMLDLLNIVNRWEFQPTAQTEEDQQKILEQGTATLDAIADYAQQYGLSESAVNRMRMTVANKETQEAFAPILENWGNIIDNFTEKYKTVQGVSTHDPRYWIKEHLLIDGMTNEEAAKLIQLNQILANATDIINQQIRNQDWDGVRQTQREVQKASARLKYGWVDWDKVDNDPDCRVERDGRFLKVKGYTVDGDVVFEY